MWKKGQSGNPAGRKKNDAAQLFRKAVAKHLPEIWETLIKQAKAGDTQAIKIIFDRTVYALKPASPPVELDRPPADGSFKAVAEVICEMMSEGRLSPTTASDALAALSEAVRISDFEAVKADLAAWREAQAAQGRAR